MTQEQDTSVARQARLVALVLLVTAVLWLGVSYLGGRFGWETRYAFLADFAAMAAFIWALAVTYGIWRKRRAN